MESAETGTSRRLLGLGRLGVAVLAVPLAVGLVVACSSSSDGGPSSTGTTLGGTEPPNLVGTWTGDYAFPFANPDGSPEVVPATEKLTIEHQEGGLVWGYDEYVDDEGQLVRIIVRGTVDAHGELTLAEENGTFWGQLQADGSLRIRFSRTDDQFTAFTAVLTRS